MSGHSTIFQKIAYSANFGHNGGKTTMFEKGRVSFSESHRLGLCGSEVKTCLHWSAYRTNWAATVYLPYLTQTCGMSNTYNTVSCTSPFAYDSCFFYIISGNNHNEVKSANKSSNNEIWHAVVYTNF